MPDPFSQYSDSPIGPAANAFAIVPHDANAVASVTKAIYVGTAGNVTLRPVNAASDVLYKNVPAGSYLTVRASHVRATGTTAADLVGEA